MKLWRVSRILNNCSPFDASLLDLTEAQLDFIILQEAEEHPGTLVITRGGQQAGLPPVRAWAAKERAWDEVLRGPALEARHQDKELTALRAAIERVKAAKGAPAPGVGNLAARVQVGQGGRFVPLDLLRPRGGKSIS